jgi:CheY-like chemotaxis protein
MGEGRRILLVDDDEGVLFVLRASLLRLGSEYEVITASQGQTALDALAEGRFALLITDMRLPGIDGLALTEHLRASGAPTAVIWITAYGCRQLRADAERLHVRHCLEKPVEIAEFRRTVCAVLEAG